VKYFFYCSSDVYGEEIFDWKSKWDNFFSLFWILEEIKSNGYPLFKNNFKLSVFFGGTVSEIG